MYAAEAQARLDFAIGYELLRALMLEEVERFGAPETAKRLRVRVRTMERFALGGLPSERLLTALIALAPDRPPTAIEALNLAANVIADLYPPNLRPLMREEAQRAIAAVLLNAPGPEGNGAT